MSTDLLDDLARLGTLFERMSRPITADQLITSRRTRPVSNEPDDNPAVHVSTLEAEAAVVVAFPSNRPTPRARVRVAAVIALVAAAIAGVVWISANRASERLPASRPDPLTPSATPDKIDLYPMLDPTDMPIAMPENRVGGTWSNSTEDQGWGGAVGMPAAAGGLPTSVIGVSVFPVGFVSTWPGAVPGRRAGISEARWQGGATLLWSADGVPWTMVGSDLDVMYELIDHVRPIAATSHRGGYELIGPLPRGLVELDAPRHRPAMWFPGIGDVDDSGTFNLSVDGISPLILLTGGHTDLATVTIGSYPGFIGNREGYIDLVFATSTDESVFMSSKVLTRAQMIAVAETIRFTDEVAWREHYGVDWGGGSASSTDSTAAIRPS